MKFFLIPLLECFREMQRLHREMSNDVAVNEKISWCDSKEWGICVINYIYIIIMFNYSTNIRPRNFLYMSQVRWKLFQSKFSNKIIRLHFFSKFHCDPTCLYWSVLYSDDGGKIDVIVTLRVVLTQHVCTDRSILYLYAGGQIDIIVIFYYRLLWQRCWLRLKTQSIQQLLLILTGSY